MQRRWSILIVLTLARATMGFQFQSIAAVGPVLTAGTAISYAALGTLMGVFLLPGALFAIPGGWLGKRFGDKKVVLVGLGMMIAGGSLLMVSSAYVVMLAGRVISGTGAVLINVLVTKMVTDWFVGRRIVLAMGCLISSWPLGIAAALMVLGPLAGRIPLASAFAFPVVACAVAWLLVAVVYPHPEDADRDETGTDEMHHEGLSRHELWGAVLSGCVWCFYNVAFILPLSFGPELLISQGMRLAEAGAVVSLASWIIIPALPMGGWIAEHVRRPDSTMAVTFVAIALLLWIVPWVPRHALMFAVLGVIFGPAGGLIMALPGRVLRSENRAVGMGIYFTVYYVGMGVVPAVAGYARDLSGTPASPFWIAGIMSLLALCSLVGFRALAAALR